MVLAVRRERLLCVISIIALLAGCGSQSGDPQSSHPGDPAPQVVELAAQSDATARIDNLQAQLDSLESELTTLRGNHGSLDNKINFLERRLNSLSADAPIDPWAWICDFMVEAYGRYPPLRTPGTAFSTSDSHLFTDDECVRLGYLPDINNR